MISRIKDVKLNDNRDDAWGYKKVSALYSPGRIFLNVWRLMRSQLTLTSYTLENTVFHIIHQRIPKFTMKQLTEWYDHGMLMRWRTLDYYISRMQYSLDLLEKTDLMAQTSEFSRVYGCDFYSVITRGSQFKVESVMSRLTRPENYLMYSPPRTQVAKMRAMECIALNMEPDSKFYTDPVSVLDFQSLYPSIMVGYNFCFSTCLGALSSIGSMGPRSLGVLTNYEIPQKILKKLANDCHISPNGIVFVKPHIKSGILGQMLKEILETRIMVKSAIKLHKNNKRLVRILSARQLGLKLLANVTYGYTAAGFSGRMPCSEIADAIVQTGRSTLEHSIAFVNQNIPNTKVVYADTDSLFIVFEGGSKEESFKRSEEIVASITKLNPTPICLKFEKVYHPAILVTKKRLIYH